MKNRFFSIMVVCATIFSSSLLAENPKNPAAVPVVELDALNVALERMEYARDINLMLSALAPWDAAWTKYYKDRADLVEFSIREIKMAIKVGTRYVILPKPITDEAPKKTIGSAKVMKRVAR